MRVEELHLKNFRCFKELDIKFPASNLAVFIGLNGAGKTAILDAIAIGLNDFIEKERPHFNSISDLNYNPDDVYYRSSSIENEITFSYKLKIRSHLSRYIKTEENKPNKPATDEQKHESYMRDFAEGIFFDYGFLCIFYKIDRKNIQVLSEQSSQENFDELKEWLNSELSFENDTKIDSGNIEFSNPRLRVIRKAMSTFFSNSNITDADFSNLKFKRNVKDSYEEEKAERNYDLYITHKERELKRELKLSQLSEGQRLLINIVCDIARHLLKIQNMDVVIETPILDSEENFLEWDYDYPAYTEEQIDAVLQRKGIVLIDEIELHLHPQWQREVLPALQKTFPNIQFIVTTHSPQVLSRVHRDDIFILKDNKLYQPSSNPVGRDSTDILCEVMDIDYKRPDEIQKLSDDYFALINKNQFEAAQKIREQLLILVNKKQLDINDPIFIRADALITRKTLLKK